VVEGCIFVCPVGADDIGVESEVDIVGDEKTEPIPAGGGVCTVEPL
jgi:hypothetical protein